MQTRHVLDGAPVAAECGAARRVDANQRRRDARSVFPSDEEQPVVRHRRRHAGEEVARQVGRGMVGAVGEGVAAIEEVPVALADVRALVRREADPRVVHAPPFLLDLFALVSMQARQKLSEVGIRRVVAIGPMKLDRAAQQPAGLLRSGAVRVVEEQHVGR